MTLLLELIQVGLGNRKHISTTPTSIEWQKTIELASEQEIVGYCFNALEQLPKDQRSGMDVLMDWLGQSEYQKYEYEHKLQVAIELADELNKDGVRKVVLKGFAFVQYYTQP